MGESRDRLFFLPACHRPNPPRRDRRKGRPERPRHPGCKRRINKLLRGRLWPRSPAWRPRAVPRRAGLAGAHLPRADQEKTAAKTKRPAANKIFSRNKKLKTPRLAGSYSATWAGVCRSITRRRIIRRLRRLRGAAFGRNQKKKISRRGRRERREDNEFYPFVLRSLRSLR